MTLTQSNKIIGSLIREVIILKDFSGELDNKEHKVLLTELKDVMECDCTDEYKNQRLQIIYNKIIGNLE